MADPESNSRRPVWSYRLLWLLVLLSFGLNLLLITTLLGYRRQAQERVVAAVAMLEAVEFQDIESVVNVDERLPISMTVSFSDTFRVPISETIPISTSVAFQDEVIVPINHTIRLDNSIIVEVEIPIIGQRVPLPIPIVTNIPVVMDVVVPISHTIPVQTEVPVDLLVEVPVESEILIETEVPVKMDIPVSIPLSQMGFDVLLESVREQLNSLAQLLGAEQVAR